MASAQLGKLKDLATDAAKDAATDRAKDAVANQAGSSLGGSSLGGLTGGSSLGKSALGGITGGSSLGGLGGVAGSAAGSLSTQDQITGAKVLLGGGSKTDAAIAIGKNRAKDLVTDQVGKGQTHTIIQKGSGSYGSGTPAPTQSYGNGTSVPAPTTTVNCPSGTKAQPDGTCMITGNWGG